MRLKYLCSNENRRGATLNLKSCRSNCRIEQLAVSKKYKEKEKKEKSREKRMQAINVPKQNITEF